MNKAITEARIEQARRESENTAFHEWWKASGHADDPIFTLTMENCAHAAWQERASNQKTCPYGYVFGGCTFLHNGSPLLTAYVKDNSIPVFLRPSENVMETYVEVMGQKLGHDIANQPHAQEGVEIPAPVGLSRGLTLSAETVLAIRDALIGDSIEEAYQLLYSAVDPGFVKLKPWAEIEASSEGSTDG